ncbi:MAG: tol-pal system YbgF family protein [Saprospiraceae bacterium]
MRFFILLIFGFSCGFGVSCNQTPELTPSEQLQEHVELLEARNGANPSAETRTELIKAYEKQSQDTSLSQTRRLDRVRYVAEALYVGGKHDQAYNRLRRGISDFQKANSVLDASLFLAEIAIQRRQEPETAELIFATIRDRFERHKGLAKIPAAYETLTLVDAQKKLQMLAYPASGFDREAAVRYGKASWAYTAIEDDEALVIKDHLAAGRVLEQAKNYALAIEHYDEVVRRFEENPRAGDALMLKAVVLQEVYSEKEEARAVLEQMIANYPEHDLANDAKSMLGSL